MEINFPNKIIITHTTVLIHLLFPFNDVYSNDGYTTLTIGAFDEAGKLDRYPKYQLTI